MDVLRHFQHAQTFRLLAQDLAGRLTVERLADHLSALADIVLDGALAACWTQIDGHAMRRRRASRSSATASWAARSWATPPTSTSCSCSTSTRDDPDADAQRVRATRGSRSGSTPGSPARRPRARCTTPTCACGPTARRACWCRACAAFQRYQREHAWLWEHQALTRARFVAGDADVGAAFEAEREAILRAAARRATLAREVVAMRRKMHAGHPNATPLFDLKHDPGGMVDIEFTVQYLVLAHAHRAPRADAQRRQHRAAAHGRRARARAGRACRAGRRRVSRISQRCSTRCG